MSQPSAPYPGIHQRPKRRSALDWAIRVVLVLVIVGLAIGIGGAIRGNWGPWKSATPTTSPTRQEVQSRALVDVQKGISGVTNVTCVMPTSWTPGDTFKCYAYGSSGRELAQMAGTVLPAASGKWAVNAAWSAV